MKSPRLSRSLDADPLRLKARECLEISDLQVRSHDGPMQAIRIGECSGVLQPDDWQRFRRADLFDRHQRKYAAPSGLAENPQKTTDTEDNDDTENDDGVVPPFHKDLLFEKGRIE